MKLLFLIFGLIGICEGIRRYIQWVRSPFRPIVPLWKQAEWGFTSEETKE